MSIEYIDRYARIEERLTDRLNQISYLSYLRSNPSNVKLFIKPLQWSSEPREVLLQDSGYARGPTKLPWHVRDSMLYTSVRFLPLRCCLCQFLVLRAVPVLTVLLYVIRYQCSSAKTFKQWKEPGNASISTSRTPGGRVEDGPFTTLDVHL